MTQSLISLILLIGVFFSIGVGGASNEVLNLELMDLSVSLGNIFVIDVSEDPYTNNIYLIGIFLDIGKGVVGYATLILGPDMKLVASIDLSNIFRIPLVMTNVTELRLPIEISVADKLYVLGIQFIGVSNEIVSEIYVFDKLTGDLRNSVSLGKDYIVFDMSMVDSGLSLLLINNVSKDLIIRIYSPDLSKHTDRVVARIEDLYTAPQNLWLIGRLLRHVYGGDYIFIALSDFYTSSGIEHLSYCGWVVLMRNDMRILNKDIMGSKDLCFLINTLYTNKRFVAIYRESMYINISELSIYTPNNIVEERYSITTNLTLTEMPTVSPFPMLFGVSINYVYVNETHRLVTNSIIEGSGSMMTPRQESEIILLRHGLKPEIIYYRKIPDVVIGSSYIRKENNIYFFGGGMSFSSLAPILKPYLIHIKLPASKETYTKTPAETITRTETYPTYTTTLFNQTTITLIQTRTITQILERTYVETNFTTIKSVVREILTSTIHESLIERDLVILLVVAIASLVIGFLIGYRLFRR